MSGRSPATYLLMHRGVSDAEGSGVLDVEGSGVLDAEGRGTQMNRLVFVQISSQSTKGLSSKTDPACRVNLDSIESLQLTS